MRRSSFSNSNPEERQIGRPTVYETASLVLLNATKDIDYKNGLDKVTSLVEEEGWQVNFLNERSANTGEFHRKDGKVIDIYLQNLDGKPISHRHQIFALVHEFLYGELTDEASKNIDPREYMKKHFIEFAEIDMEVADAVDKRVKRSASMTGFMATRHTTKNLRIGLEENEITRLLSK